MIVPQYWAESRVQYRKQGRQVTVRRFGWSDNSQDAAQVNADERAQAALQRLLSGEKLPRREPKVPYNGGEGMARDRISRFVEQRPEWNLRVYRTPAGLPQVPGPRTSNGRAVGHPSSGISARPNRHRSDNCRLKPAPRRPPASQTVRLVGGRGGMGNKIGLS